MAYEEFQHTVETLPNGLRLAWLNLPHLHSVAIHICVRSGSAYETRENNGVSHLLEHLHMATSRSYPTREAFSAAFAALPGWRNAYTSPDQMAFRFTVSPQSASEVLALAVETVEPRIFDKELIQIEKLLIESEMSSSSTAANIHQLALSSVYRNHSLTLPILGTLRSLRRLKPGQIEEFQRASFAPNRITVGLVGPLTPDLLNRAREQFGQLRSGPTSLRNIAALPSIKLPRVVARNAQRGPVVIQLAFFCDEPRDRATQATQNIFDMAFNRGDGSLSPRVRYGDCPTYQLDNWRLRLLNVNMFSITAIVPCRRQTQVLRTLMDELRSLMDKQHCEKWLSEAIPQIRHLMETALDSPHYLAQSITDAEFDPETPGNATPAETLRTLDEISPEDLAAYARKAFRPDRCFLHYGRSWPFTGRRLRKMLFDYLG